MREAQRDSTIVEYDTVAGKDRKSITKNRAHFSPRRAINMEMKLICTYEALFGREHGL